MLIFNLFFAFFSFIYAIFIVRYLYYWLATKTLVAENSQDVSPISIVIAVRNEASGIAACIDSILQQNYPAFEIIVIDDFSSDKTCEIVSAYAEANIYCYSLQEIMPKEAMHSMNKKTAIEYGVQQSRYGLIATIDGDCMASEEWLLHINSSFVDEKIMYATGVVCIEEQHNFLEAFQQIDLLSLIGVTAASIQMKSAYMSNGANMAFRKKAFQMIGGYEMLKELPTGDDVFLMHRIIQEFGDESCVFIKNKKSAVITTACKSLGAFVQQRVRWVSKATSLLSKRVTFTLIFMYFYHCLFLFAALLFLFNGMQNVYPLLAFFLWKISFDFLFLNSVSSYFKKRKLLVGLVLFEVFYIFYVIIIGVMGLRGKYTWKNRSI